MLFLAVGTVLTVITAGGVFAERAEHRPVSEDVEEKQDDERTEQSENPWEPFESEMDWRFASWAIQEGLTLGSIDRALEIPGVSTLNILVIIADTP